MGAGEDFQRTWGGAMKVLTVVGARPQFIKASAVSKAIEEFNRCEGMEHIKEVLVHTGQHYDYEMSIVSKSSSF